MLQLLYWHLFGAASLEQLFDLSRRYHNSTGTDLVVVAFSDTSASAPCARSNCHDAHLSVGRENHHWCCCVFETYTLSTFDCARYQPNHDDNDDKSRNDQPRHEASRVCGDVLVQHWRDPCTPFVIGVFTTLDKAQHEARSFVQTNAFSLDDEGKFVADYYGIRRQENYLDKDPTCLGRVFLEVLDHGDCLIVCIQRVPCKEQFGFSVQLLQGCAMEQVKEEDTSPDTLEKVHVLMSAWGPEGEYDPTLLGVFFDKDQMIQVPRLISVEL